jgi:hypothetical protein
MPRFPTTFLAILGLLVSGGFATWIVFDADMRAARAALAGRSKIANTTMGAIEYAEVGEGTPLLE